MECGRQASPAPMNQNISAILEGAIDPPAAADFPDISYTYRQKTVVEHWMNWQMS